MLMNIYKSGGTVGCNHSFIIVSRLILISLFFLLSSCSFFVSKATEDFGHSLSQVILNHNDPETISEAIPTYLLLLETLIIDDPDNEALLSSTATLYGAYVSLISNNPIRKKQLADKAFNFALRAACTHSDHFCQLNQAPYNQFESIIKQIKTDDLDVIYGLGSAWVLWIQANKSDWNAVAQLAQVKLLMTQITTLDHQYKGGFAYVYLGVLATILPPALGGAPELGKQYFETAIKLSAGKNLMIKVIYAKHYARMMFDRPLHDRLLHEVIAAKLEQPDLTLMNTLAKQQAEALLQSADAYF